MTPKGTQPQPAIVLYSYWRSSSAWRVRIALELKQLSYEIRPIDLLQQRQSAPDFERRSPLSQVPVLELEVDGQALRLTQSMAMLDLLERMAPEPPLYPAQATPRACALEAAELVNSGVQPLQNLSVQQHITRLGGDAVAFSRSYVARGLAALERLATERAGRFSVGDELCIADVLLVPQMYAARRLAVDLSPFSTLTAIERRCAELPAFARAHPERQPDAPEETPP